MAPDVSVVMPVFNGAAYLREAIASILGQTHAALELIVIDDGSQDDSAAIAASFGDPRLRLLRNDGNRGLVETRNRGIDAATGRFIAFLDADDVALPQRLAVQLVALDSYPALAAVGSAAQPIDAAGRTRSAPWRMAGDPAFCRAMLVFRQWFVTSSITARAEVLRALRFSREVPLAEDLHLYQRLADRWHARNLDQVLIRYRLHGQNTTTTRREELRASLAVIHRQALARLGIAASDDELALHRSIEWHDRPADAAWLAAVEAWLRRIRAANLAHGRYEPQAFAAVLSEVWLSACEAASAAAQRDAVLRFASSPLSTWRGTPLARLSKLALRPWLAARRAPA